MDETEEQTKAMIKVGGIVAGIVLFLLVGIFIWHSWTSNRSGEIVLHSGVTYTGPTPTPGAGASGGGGKFTVAENTPWKEVKGVLYQYTFQSPETLELVRFPNDPYDIYAVKWGTILPSSAVLIGVDDLSKNEKLKEYINQPKISYVENWWKQFGSLSGVVSITPFTNSKEMKGYKAKYQTSGGPSPVDDIFFEVPGKKNLVIHLSNGVLDQAVFDKIIDTVGWADTKATPTKKVAPSADN